MLSELGKRHWRTDHNDKDNARELIGHEWTSVYRQFFIEDDNSEAYHPNQNLSERRGGDMKTSILKLFHNTP